MTPSNLESLIVIVEPKGRHVEEAFAYPQNASRRWIENVSVDHTNNEGSIARPVSKAVASGDKTASHLRLDLTLRSKDLLKGYIFGTDEKTCDVLLQRSKALGISGNHFSIQIDWDTCSPKLYCLSERGFRLKEESTGRCVRILSRNDKEIIPPSATLLIEVIERFELTISCPERGRLQSLYDENLKDYYRIYNDAVPDVSIMMLDQLEKTPFISRRWIGLNGGDYYTTKRLTTGDAEYDSKVFLYDAKGIRSANDIWEIASPEPEPISRTRGKQPEGCRTQLDRTRSPSGTAQSDTATESLFHKEKSQLYVVKHFRGKQAAWHPAPWEAEKWNRLQHANILRVIDFIVEGAAFIVINECFLPITLESILQDAAPLSSEESGFVIGQVLDGLNYLHELEWIHGNVDPRSIMVLARNLLFVKLADFTLSGITDLGKPEGYHDLYASQIIAQAHDQRHKDIWSTGVVGLRLLHGKLPERTRSPLTNQRGYVVKLVYYLRAVSQVDDRNDGLRFLTRVMRPNVKDRPTARELLEDPWIIETKKYEALLLLVSRLATPQGSRHTSEGPSYHPNTHGQEYAPGPSHARVKPYGKGPSSNLSNQTPTDPSFREI